MSIRLRELIRNVRACKTAAQERECISKECAAIRTSFKEEDDPHRHRNVAKLLFIHMLGYPTHFGQMECLKLVASQKFTEKRIGYLALMLLLDENQEVLMLVTNSLKNDLNHPNQYVVGLALCALGNISSTDMARDLSSECEKLLASSNAYIRKKAALCTIRIFRKVPDLLDQYLDKIGSLLNDRNHGVLCASLALMVEMCEADEEWGTIAKLRKYVPNLVRMLKTLVLSGYAPEHDVNGITDPFLQVKMLRVLHYLGKNDTEASDHMSDILAQVATNTESAKNAGNSILYECVLTIMGVESESGLRVLAINILGRFLLNRDNNIRYVALNTLAKVISADMQAVQRHRNTIVDCLKDPDISIRRRALDLVYLLVNENNIRVLVRELLNYLLVADPEFKSDLTTKICMVVQKYAPNRRWHVDTVIKVLIVAGEYVTEEATANLTAIISQTPELHQYTAHKMYRAMLDDTAGSSNGITTQQTLIRVGVWCIGEYGDSLVAGTPAAEVDEETMGPVSEHDVIGMFTQILAAPTSTIISKEYVLTALLKLSTRFKMSGDSIRALTVQYQSHIVLELQQRAVENLALFGFDGLRSKVLEMMPAIEIKDSKKKKEGDVGDSDMPAPRLPAASSLAAPKAPAAGGGLMDDLLGLDVPAGNTTSQPSAAAAPASAGQDLLDLLGGGPAIPAANPAMPTQAAAQPAPAAGSELLDLLGGGTAGGMPAMGSAMPAMGSAMPAMGSAMPAMGSAMPAMAGAMPAVQPMPTMAPSNASGDIPPIVAYDKNGVIAKFEFVKTPGNLSLTQINVTITSSKMYPLSNFALLAAVPKFMKLQMNPPSSNTVPPNGQGTVTQIIRIANSQYGQKPAAMKLKVDYVENGQPVSETLDVANLPSGL